MRALPAAHGKEMAGKLHRYLTAPLALTLLVITTTFRAAEDSPRSGSTSAKQPTVDRAAADVDGKRVLPRSLRIRFMPTNGIQHDAEAMEKECCHSQRATKQKRIRAVENRIVSAREATEKSLMRKNSHHDRFVRVLGKKLSAKFLKLNLQDPDEIDVEEEIRRALEQLRVESPAEAKTKKEAAGKEKGEAVATVE